MNDDLMFRSLAFTCNHLTQDMEAAQVGPRLLKPAVFSGAPSKFGAFSMNDETASGSDIASFKVWNSEACNEESVMFTILSHMVNVIWTCAARIIEGCVLGHS